MPTLVGIQPVQDILPFIQSIDPAVDPTVSITSFTSATITLNNGVEIVATGTADFSGNLTITGADAFAPDDTLLFSVVDASISTDGDFVPILLDALATLDIELQDADFSGPDPVLDFVDADAWIALVQSFAALEPDISADDALNGLVVDFGAEELPDGATFAQRTAGDVIEYDVARADVTVSLEADASVAISSADGSASVTELEELRLSDGSYLYDLSARADVVYRLYAATLDRTPDRDGFLFWEDTIAGLSLGDARAAKAVAQQFADSQEFEDNFLADPSDEAFVEALYQNVLNRTADEDPGGRDFWLGAFQSGQLDRADMLIAFANSAENVDGTASDIDDGYWVVAS